ncbi:tetratricopeptide repeat protein, partial [Crenobacter intestini]
MTKLSSPVANTERHFRIFLSSTFRDMELERDHLLQHVFPVFRQECLRRQVTFTEIDLRWGVTEEDAKNGQTVEICLQEIDKCRSLGVPPFFLGFLGERYGWIPLEQDLSHYWNATAHSSSKYRESIELALKNGISVTDLEIRFGFLDQQKDDLLASRVGMLLRDPSFTAKICQETKSEMSFYDADPLAQEKLKKLKADILAKRPDCILADQYASIEEFGKAVMHFLMDQLDLLFPADQLPDAESQRQHAHQIYARSRLDAYVPIQPFQDDLLKAVALGAQGNGPQKLAVVGPSGQGKSALLASVQQQLSAQQDLVLLGHYTGADGNPSINIWRDRVIAFAQSFGPLLTDIPQDEEARWECMYSILAEAQAKASKPLILLLDAINQFADAKVSERRLQVLKLPPHVVLLVSSISLCDESGWQIHTLPPLDNGMRSQVIHQYLDKHSKKLDSNLIEQITGKDSSNNPLYLRLLLEELRLHASHEELGSTTLSLLQHTDAGALFVNCLHQLDKDFSAYGADLGSRAARLMACSRAGMAQHDLAVLLGNENAPHETFRLADVVMVPLMSRLEPFFYARDGRLSIMHAILTNSLLADPETTKHVRCILANYFTGSDAFSLAERTHQSILLKDSDTLVNILGDMLAFHALWSQYTEVVDQALQWLGAGNVTPQFALLALKQSWQRTLVGVEMLDDLSSIGVWCHERSYLHIGCAWTERVLDLSKVLLPNGHPDIAISLNNLASLYDKQGRFEAAEPLYQEALAISRAALPAGHPHVDLSLDSLANLYQQQGRYDTAESLYQEVLTNRHAAFIAAFPNIVTGLHHALQQQDREDLAELLSQDVLAIRGGALLAGQPNIATSPNNQASQYNDQGLYDAAEQEALALRDGAHIAEFKSFGRSLNNLACLHQQQGRYDEAESLFQYARMCISALFPAGHPRIATVLNNQAGLHQKQGRFEVAEPLYQEALAIRRAAFPAGHPEIAAGLNNLASLYSDQGRYDVAEPLYQEALAIRRAALSAGHPNIATSLNNLAYLYQQQDRYDAAEPLCQEALAINRAALPAGHPEIATSLDNLACL